ncbi:MAG: sialidase family protein [Planctomycetota bacterium]
MRKDTLERRLGILGAVAILSGMMAVGGSAPAGENPQADPAAGGGKVNLLAGFEKDEATKWGYVDQEGELVTPREIEKSPGAGKGTWPRAIVKGDASQGEWAYVRRFSEDAWKFYMRRGGQPEEFLYPNCTAFSTFAAFRKMFPADWTGHDRLRLDVKILGSAAALRLHIEDEMIAPQLTRDYQVPEGKWVTLEFDLAEAAKFREVKLPPELAKKLGGETQKARLINLSRMANILLRVEKAEKRPTVLVDNIRLLAPGADDGGKMELLVDKSPFPVPEPLPLRDEPAKADKPQGARNWAALKPGEPVQVAMASGSAFGNMTLPRALAVADNDHLIFGNSIGRTRVTQSADGGKTWTDLAGKPGATTQCLHTANAPGNVAVAAGEDMFVFYTARCGGAGSPKDMYCRRARFDGKGWNLGAPRLMDIDVRHCPEHLVRAIRLPNGRVWVVWMHLDRFNQTYLRCRYSDDGGELWQSPDSNGILAVKRTRDPAALPVGVTWWPESPAGWTVPDQGRTGGIPGRFHPHGAFDLAPYGASVACLYAEGDKATCWTWFDTAKNAWTAPAPVAKGFGGATSAATVGEKTVYAAIRGSNKLVCLDGDTWTEEAPAGYSGRGVLSVSGKTLFCFWPDEKEGKTLIMSAKKPLDGAWSAPEKLAEETEKLQGLSAPMSAPENFVPLAWGPRGGWIKFLRVPTERPTK